MKNIFLILMISLAVYQAALSQNIGINSTGATPAASAMLDIVSTDKGLLIPRVALTATNAAGPVTSPATSLLVYNTATAGTIPNNVIPGYYYWSGTAWVAFTNSAPASTAWTLGGNTGITASNFVGTGDDKALIFKSNNQSFLEFGNRGTLGLTQGYTDYDNASEKVSYVRSALQFEAASASFYKPKMWTDTNGNFRVKGSSAGTDYFEFGSTGTSNNGGFEFVIGDDGDEPIIFKSYHYINGMTEIMRLQSGRMAVGSNAFDATNPEKLLIDAGTTTSYNLMTGKGSIDNYLQINVKNGSAGTSASSDLVASANNGTEVVNYIDMGINSSGYTNTSLPVLGGINTAYLYSTGNDFVIGNATAAKPIRFFTGGTANANERLRIDGTGKVGIANLAPSEALDVTGNVRFSGALMPNNSAGTSGYVLQSNGAGAAPTWITPGSLVGGSGWALDGNAVAANRNFGTTSNFPIPFITNNTEKMRLFAAGGLAVGATVLDGTNPEELLVNAGVTTSVNAIVGKGSINNYLQLNIQNQSAGANASSDVVATANNGSETTNYIDMGINSSGNTSAVMGGADDAYLYNIGQNLLVGTGTAAKSLVFMTGGTTQATNERMRIDGTGKVGIGNTVPSEILDVTGNLELTGAFMPGGTAGTSGYVLTSAGAGTSPTWSNPTAVLNTFSWALDGNAVAANRNFGTTSNFSLPFITNNTERMQISNTGNVAVGTTTFDGTNPEKFIVNAGTTSSVNAIVGKGSINNYLQLNIQNQSNGTNASADVVATADNGSETTNYIDMGVNSSANASGIMGGPNDAYLYNMGQNLLIGTGTAAKSVIFMTGGTTQSTDERMRITGTGNVGIRNNNPTSTLAVTGSIAVAYRSGTGAYTILSTDHVVINTGAAATWTMPNANTCPGRIYRLVNQGTGDITLSRTVRTASGTTSTTLVFAAGTNNYEILSDGTEWRKIN